MMKHRSSITRYCTMTDEETQCFIMASERHTVSTPSGRLSVVVPNLTVGKPKQRGLKYVLR